MRPSGRAPDELRKTIIKRNYTRHAEGSVLICCGETRVLCTASVEERVPPFLRGKGEGWVTAEYAMLPTATSERMQRESVKGKLGGRTYEIQRLVGRSLRGVVDTSALGERTVTVDCDVIQADGGTRCASITGGYIALVLALRKAGLERAITSKIAAISVGIVENQGLLVASGLVAGEALLGIVLAGVAAANAATRSRSAGPARSESRRGRAAFQGPSSQGPSSPRRPTGNTKRPSRARSPPRSWRSNRSRAVSRSSCAGGKRPA